MRNGKGHKLPFTSYDYIYTSPLKLLQIDVWGPALVLSSGYMYYVSIAEAFSRFT